MLPTNSVFIVILLCLVNSSNLSKFTTSCPPSVQADFTKTYNKSVSQSGRITFNYLDLSVQSKAVRVHVAATDAQPNYPLLFVVKDQKNVLSWQVPLILQHTYSYYNVSRTLCPEKSLQNNTNNEINIDVSTMSLQPIQFQLMAELIDINIELGQVAHLKVSPSEPKYLHFKFPLDQDTVVIEMSSDDKLCMILSIQDITCPVFDLTRDVEFTGEYQTVDRQGAITVQKSWLSEFFIVLVVKSSDIECSGSQTLVPAGSHRVEREKQVNITVTSAISETQFELATIGAACWFLTFYLIAFFISCGYHIRHRNDSQEQLLDPTENTEREPLLGSSVSSPRDQSYGATAEQHTSTGDLGPPPQGNSVALPDSDDGSMDETDVDMLYDVSHEKDVFRTKSHLYVSDLSRKPNKYLHKKYKLYPWNLIVIAIFYALPVMQLVLTYQKVLNVTGNQDICYYNFKCARRLGVLSSFNNVYSNIGYVMLGLLFLILVYRRNRYHAKRVALNDRFDKYYGIPQHFGLFYGMGIALVMEGVLSASYHVCPSYTNFQFDTSFMYMIAWLCMLKIYQSRHPDINANAHTAFFAISLVIFLAVLGVFARGVVFICLFAVIHIVVCFIITFHVYYMGRWSADLGVFKRIYLLIKTDRIHCIKPLYVDRMILLIIGNLVNWSLAIYGIVLEPRDFASYLVAIFIANLLMYFAFYIIMKLRSGERIMFQPIVYTVIATVVWCGALFFFQHSNTSFSLTPAKSRQLNRDCILLDFFDGHDVWHFLSSMALFFGFMILLTLDDDLVQTPRDKIPVF